MDGKGTRVNRVIFHLTQLFTGHGCFALYLFRIQKVGSDACEHCGTGAVDTADHTLQTCIVWTDEREALKRVVGGDLLLGQVTREILRDKDSWMALLKFARTVMRRKEEMERERERRGSPSIPPLPRSTGGTGTES